MGNIFANHLYDKALMSKTYEEYIQLTICFGYLLRQQALILMYVHVQLCPTLCNPTDCSTPGSSVHGIFPGEYWVAISSFRGSSRPRDQTCISHISWIVGGFFTAESPEYFGLEVENEAGKRLTEFYQEDTLVIASTLFQTHKRWLYTWTPPDGQPKSDWLYSLQLKMEKIYTASKKKTWSWLCLGPSALYSKILA